MRVFLIIIGFFVSLNLVGQTTVNSPILRTNNSDTSYGTHYDSLKVGGDHLRYSKVQRDSIPFNMRLKNMRVRTTIDDSTFSWNGSNWVPVIMGGLDSLNNFIIKKGTASTREKNNIGIGFQAGDSLSSGANNIAIGKLALLTGKTASENVAIGYQSMQKNINGYQTAIGAYTMSLNSPGLANTAIGYAALYSDSTGGSYNTAVGYFSLFNNKGGGSLMGSHNTAIGYYALNKNQYSSANVAVGNTALYKLDNPQGGSNTALGYSAGYNIASGYNNTLVGTQALYSATQTPGSNTVMGRNSGYDVTVGGYNTFLGYNTGRGITTGSFNTILGCVSYNFPANTRKALYLGNSEDVTNGTNIYLFIDSNRNTQLFGKLSLPDTTTAKSFKVINGTASQILTANGSILTAGSNITISSGQISASNSGISTINGTNNQIVATNLSNTVTLSLPQDIATTSSPTFNGGYFTNTILGTSANFNGTIRIGTNAATDTSYKLYVEKGIRTRKVKVDVDSWADYVFAPSYKLMPLQDLETYIITHQHLPDVPTTEAVYKGGIDVGENQALLLKKVEELTLYLIEQAKKTELQNKRIADLEAQLQAITSEKKSTHK